MATPRKAAATKKAARPPAKVLSPFDKARKELIDKRDVNTVFEWAAYDRTWHVIRPNPALLQQMKEDKATFMEFVLGHFIADEREDFLATLASDEAFDIDLVHLVVTEIEEIVYAEIPLG